MYRAGVEATLREIALLLDKFGGPDYAPGIRDLADDAARATDDLGRSDVARRILHLYQGASGGFGDIVLQPEATVDLPAQARLQTLQSRLFDEARAAL